MDAKNCLATLEIVHGHAKSGDLHGRHELVKHITELQRFADDQFRQGNTQYHHVSVAAAEALVLASSDKASSFDQFTSDRIVSHGAMGLGVLERVIEEQTVQTA